MSKIAMNKDHRTARRIAAKAVLHDSRHYPKGYGIGRYPDQFRALTGRAKLAFRRYMKAAYSGWVETGRNTIPVYDENGRVHPESGYWQQGVRNAPAAA